MTISKERRKPVSAHGATSIRHITHLTGTTSPTSSQTSKESEIESDIAKLSAGTLAYFQERFRARIYDLVVRELEAYKARGATQAQLARRIGKRADQISRWLSNPGNLTLDTISDLLLGLSGGELKMEVEHPTRAPIENYRTPAWSNVSAPPTKRPPALSLGYAILDVPRPAIIDVASNRMAILI